MQVRKIFEDLWERILKDFGLRPCCENPDIVTYAEFLGGHVCCQNCKWERPYVPLGY